MQNKIKPGQEVFLNVDPTGKKLQVFAKKIKTIHTEEVEEMPSLQEPAEDETTENPTE